jgi:transcriptional antiterminator RfaH
MAYWAVVRVRARQEALAADQLEKAGFEVFAPKTRAGPLFPTYTFVRIDGHWRAIERTVGVLGLVKFGEAPARCPDGEIAALQRRVDARGLIRLPSPRPRRRSIPPGAKVRIGALTAIYAGMTARERELVLIDFLGRRLMVEVASMELELAPLVR